jgi:hypothetical protein
MVRNIEPRFRVRTVADFTVGQEVFVAAHQGVRKGVVTGLGRTRIKVRHPKNKAGDVVERPYPMSRVVVGKTLTAGRDHAVFADGYDWEQRGDLSRVPVAYRED